MPSVAPFYHSTFRVRHADSHPHSTRVDRAIVYVRSRNQHRQRQFQRFDQQMSPSAHDFLPSVVTVFSVAHFGCLLRISHGHPERLRYRIVLTTSHIALYWDFLPADFLAPATSLPPTPIVQTLRPRCPAFCRNRSGILPVCTGPVFLLAMLWQPEAEFSESCALSSSCQIRSMWKSAFKLHRREIPSRGMTP